LLFSTEPGQRALFKSTEFGPRLRPFVDIINKSGEVVGFATIVYDNFGLFFFKEADKSTIDEVEKRLIGNARNFNITWKELGRFSAEGHFDSLMQIRDRSGKRVSTEKQTVFLGVQFDFFNADSTRWRHADKRKEKAKEVKSLMSRPFLSPRHVATAVGLLVWHACINMRRLGSLKNIIDELKTFRIAKKSDWDTLRLAPSEEWRNMVSVLMDEITTNDWVLYTLAPIDMTSCVFCASDASDDWAGGVIFDPEDFEHPFLLKYHQEASVHIFLKEVLAVANVVARVLTLIRDGHISARTIVIAVDSIPARRAFEKGYSTNDAANKMIVRALNLLDTAGVRLVLKDIESQANVADCLTKWDSPHVHTVDKPFCLDRLNKTWLIVTGQRPGRSGVSSCSKKLSEECIFELEGDQSNDWLQDLHGAAYPDDTCQGPPPSGVGF
jgi:hypothetical protein